jgi:hypothetical protein
MEGFPVKVILKLALKTAMKTTAPMPNLTGIGKRRFGCKTYFVKQIFCEAQHRVT